LLGNERWLEEIKAVSYDMDGNLKEETGKKQVTFKEKSRSWGDVKLPKNGEINKSIGMQQSC